MFSRPGSPVLYVVRSFLTVVFVCLSCICLLGSLARHRAFLSVSKYGVYFFIASLVSEISPAEYIDSTFLSRALPCARTCYLNYAYFLPLSQLSRTWISVLVEC